MENTPHHQNKIRNILIYLGLVIFGIIIGGFLFADSQPRSFLNITRCKETCLQMNELTGLVGSVGMLKLDGLIPNKVFETDKTLVIEHPFPDSPTHLVIIPKKDIKNIGEIAESDNPYIIDAMAVIRELVREKGLTKYKIVTYGPGLQEVAYLHFHLMSDEK